MGRTLLYPFAGAGIGFLVAFVIVAMMAGAQPSSDWAVITLFVGTFLAGTGAIAGAIIGGVEFFKRRQQATDAPGAQGEIQPTPRWVWTTLLVCLLAVMVFCAKLYSMRMVHEHGATVGGGPAEQER